MYGPQSASCTTLQARSTSVLEATSLAQTGHGVKVRYEKRVLFALLACRPAETADIMKREDSRHALRYKTPLLRRIILGLRFISFMSLCTT